MSAPGILIAAPASGSGKTTSRWRCCARFRRRGRTVGCVQGRPRLYRPDVPRPRRRPALPSTSTAGRCASRPSRVSATGRPDGVDLVLGEGVMGLFDGAADGQGSTADLASLFDLPVMLVVDVRGMGASVGGPDRGLHPPSRRCRGRGHPAQPRRQRRARGAAAARLRRPLRPAGPRLPAERSAPRAAGAPPRPGPGRRACRRSTAGSTARPRSSPSGLDLDRLIRLARPLGLGLYGPPAPPAPAARPADRGRPGYRLRLRLPGDARGLAARGRRDPAVLAARRRAPDPGADAVYLPGGYPELHAGRLAANRSFPRRPARRGRARRLRLRRVRRLHGARPDPDRRAGERHAMAGLLPVATSFAAAARCSSATGALKLLGAEPARPGRHHLSRPRVPLRQPGRGRRRARRCSRSATPAAGRSASSARAPGNVAGSFLHLIDRVTEPGDGATPPPPPARGRGLSAERSASGAAH